MPKTAIPTRAAVLEAVTTLLPLLPGYDLAEVHDHDQVADLRHSFWSVIWEEGTWTIWQKPDGRWRAENFTNGGAGEGSTRDKALADALAILLEIKAEHGEAQRRREARQAKSAAKRLRAVEKEHQAA